RRYLLLGSQHRRSIGGWDNERDDVTDQGGEAGYLIKLTSGVGGSSSRRGRYSWRSAITGSTRAARPAGTTFAISATTASTTNAIAKLTASNGGTNSTLDSTCAPSAASPAPIAPPITTSCIPSPRTICTNARGWAPRALRIPISRTRRLTEYAITPYNPTAATM